MNCKPGDLAYVVARVAAIRGRIVTVLHAAPTGADFILPNGTLHAAIAPDGNHWWLCELVTAVKIPWTLDGRLWRHFDGRYTPIPDRDLRPIRDPGEDAVDELLRPLPQEVVA